MQVRNYFDVTGSVKQILKELALDSLNLILLPADGNMDIIAVSAAVRILNEGRLLRCMHALKLEPFPLLDRSLDLLCRVRYAHPEHRKGSVHHLL